MTFWFSERNSRLTGPLRFIFSQLRVPMCATSPQNMKAIGHLVFEIELGEVWGLESPTLLCVPTLTSATSRQSGTIFSMVFLVRRPARLRLSSYSTQLRSSRVLRVLKIWRPSGACRPTCHSSKIGRPGLANPPITADETRCHGVPPMPESSKSRNQLYLRAQEELCEKMIVLQCRT